MNGCANSMKCTVTSNLRAEIRQLEEELNVFQQAVEIVTDKEFPNRSCTSSTGWTMIASSRYMDLLVTEERLQNAGEECEH